MDRLRDAEPIPGLAEVPPETSTRLSPLWFGANLEDNPGTNMGERKLGSKAEKCLKTRFVRVTGAGAEINKVLLLLNDEREMAKREVLVEPKSPRGVPKYSVWPFNVTAWRRVMRGKFAKRDSSGGGERDDTVIANFRTKITLNVLYTMSVVDLTENSLSCRRGLSDDKKRNTETKTREHIINNINGKRCNIAREHCIDGYDLPRPCRYMTRSRRARQSTGNPLSAKADVAGKLPWRERDGLGEIEDQPIFENGLQNRVRGMAETFMPTPIGVVFAVNVSVITAG